MKTLNYVLKNCPEQATLINSVIRKVGIESVKDINNHGIDGGFNGFIYTYDIVAFYKRHKAAIKALLANEYKNLGYKSVLEMLKEFNCFKNVDEEDLANAYYGNKDPNGVVFNGLTWYAAEWVCRLFEN